MNLSRVRCLVIFALIFHLCGYALAADLPLAKTIDQALGDPVLAHGIQGVQIESLKDGRVLYAKNSNLVFVPASNFKLVVGAASLDLLGPAYRFPTSLRITGGLKDGVLKGDVILVGGGDPVLKTEHLQDMAAKLKAMGIKTIKGNVVGDDTRFDDVRLGWGWAWDDEPYYYSAQISALNLNENVVDVWVRPGMRVGSPALVRVIPPTGYMTIRNECKTSAVGSEKTLLVDRVHGRNVIRVTGNVPLDYKPVDYEEAITVDEPTLFACQSFIEILRRVGISVTGQPVRGKTPAGARLVVAHLSPPMSEMLALLNKPSDNLIAECLFKNLGAQAELDFLKKAGADLSAVAIVDGSGLSRKNLISPANLVTLLNYTYKHEHGKVFLNSLPIAGVDGTLKNRMKGTEAQGNVRAKTGYVNHVSTISGFVTTKSGEQLVFSIMMNNHLCRNKEATAVQDKILEALANLGG